MMEKPEGIKEFEKENLPMILNFVKTTLSFLAHSFDGYMPPFILSYGLGKYGSEGYCSVDEETGEVEFITFDVFCGDLLDTICREYAHAVGYDEKNAVELAKEWSGVIREHSVAS